jgi:hypothetical protein
MKHIAAVFTPASGGWLAERVPPSLNVCLRLTARPLLWAAMTFLLAAPGSHAQMATFSPATRKADRTITIAITPWGIRPSKITIPPGPVALLIENRSRVRDLAVTVTQDGKSGAALTSRHSPNKADLRHFVTVQPGTYHLTAAGLPSAWQCTITVSAK